MGFLQRVAYRDVATHGEALRLTLHLVVAERHGGAEVQVLLLQERPAGREGAHLAAVLAAVAFGLLVREGQSEVGFPWLDVQAVVHAQSHGAHIAVIDGFCVFVAVLVGGEVCRHRYVVPQLVGIEHIGGCQTETVQLAVDARRVVDLGSAVALLLCVAVIAGTQVEVVAQTGAGHGRIDIARGGEQLFVGEVVLLSGEGT